MGTGKLRRLHNITTLSKAIPTKYINKNVCEVCALLKIKKISQTDRGTGQIKPFKINFYRYLRTPS